MSTRASPTIWGYNTIGFFAPTPRYAADVPNSLREFKEMVARFHEAGLEIILDVVYNHTAEGNEKGPTLSFKGIDNATYYRLLPDRPRYYINDTGTGNTLNLSHGRVIQMVTDSLRYWVEEMHVDGFRFDLGTILAREPNGFDNQSGFLKAVGQDPVLGAVKLIAEPWDIGPGGYQVGSFPPGWAEWTDKFRDDMQRLLARASGGGPAGGALVRLGGVLQPRRPPVLGLRQLRHRPRRLHPQRRRYLRREAQRRRTARTTATATPTTAPGTAGSRDRPTTRASTSCARGRSATCWRRFCCRRARRCCSPATSSGVPRAATTTAYCQDSEISWLELGDRGEGARPDRLHPQADLAASALSHPAPQPLPDRRVQRGHRRTKDLTWIATNGSEMGPGEWDDAEHALHRHAPRRTRARHEA